MNPSTTDPIEIGTHGFVRGAKFYLGLQHKRVKGKFRVRGHSKDHYSNAQLGKYTPEQWDSMTPEQRKQKYFAI